jgi:hypothetical protein
MMTNRIRRIVMNRTVISSFMVAGLLLSGVAAHAQGHTCSNAILQGAYGNSVGMLVLPAPGIPVSAATPRAVLLRISFDGKGNFTAIVTLNDDGTVIKSTDVGTYTINPDCTGTVYTNGGTRSVDIVVVDSGNEFYSIRTDPPNLVFIFNAAKKIFPGNTDAQDR